MNVLGKVLVVDSGHRAETDLLSTQLAELGVASITTSMEAAEAVLDMIDTPSAVLVNMPSQAEALESLRRLSVTLRRSERISGVPVIEWNREDALKAGGISAVLRAGIGQRASAERET